MCYFIHPLMNIYYMNDLSYNHWNSMSDTALQKVIGRFIQIHRLRQNKSQDETAAEAGISRSTLSLLENGENVRTDSLIRVLRVLNLLHVMDAFDIKEEISPIEYAKLKKKERKQASPAKNKPTNIPEVEW